MTASGKPYGNMVTILKEGKRINIEEEKLCQGDTVLLQTGDIVPADLRLIEAKGLEIDEFDITGEILPVVKKANGNDEAGKSIENSYFGRDPSWLLYGEQCNESEV